MVLVVFFVVGGLKLVLKHGIIMMTGRPGRVPLKFLPDEARSLPPPKLTDPRLAYIGFLGYCSGLLDNAIRRRPVMLAGEGCAGGRGCGERGSQGCGPAPPVAEVPLLAGPFRLGGPASPSWGICAP